MCARAGLHGHSFGQKELGQRVGGRAAGLGWGWDEGAQMGGGGWLQLELL